MISLAATIARRHVFDAFYSNDPNAALMHGPTYMGNPLACAAANASIDLFEQEPRLEQVAAMEEICRARLTPLEGAPHVCGVRILGGFAAVQVSTNLNKRRWMEFFVSQGVWLRPTRDVFYLAPPLNVAPTDLHRLCDVLIAAVAAYGESVDPGAEELRP
jgi:adenosylmethionine-8-amino-7-oxononanoate aminotransferase